MTPSNDDPWAQLQRGKQNWVGQRVSADHILDAFWAIHPTGAPGLVIQSVPFGAVPKILPKPRGISLAFERRDEGQGILTMFLNASQDRGVFLRLCSDILAYASAAADSLAAAVAAFERIRRWQSLLGLARGNQMTPEEVRGLIAELWLLDAQIAPRVGFDGALAAWVAPDGHPQDFAFPRGLIEVKSRIAGSRNVIRITSFEQLDVIGALLLVVVELAPTDEPDSLSLNDMVAGLIERARGVSIDLMERVEESLGKRGYAVSSDYDLQRYVVSGLSVLETDASFPAIRKSQIDARIVRGDYSIDLTSLGSFLREPEHALSRLVD